MAILPAVGKILKPQVVFVQAFKVKAKETLEFVWSEGDIQLPSGEYASLQLKPPMTNAKLDSELLNLADKECAGQIGSKKWLQFESLERFDYGMALTGEYTGNSTAPLNSMDGFGASDNRGNVLIACVGKKTRLFGDGGEPFTYAIVAFADATVSFSDNRLSVQSQYWAWDDVDDGGLGVMNTRAGGAVSKEKGSAAEKGFFNRWYGRDL